MSEVVAFSKIEIKWVWVSDVHVYIKSDAVYLILTMLSCENPSNIWEFNYLPPMCGANELAGKIELVLLLNEWISLFSHGTFQLYVFMLSARFARTSGNNFNCITKHGAILFSQHLEAYLLLGLWWTCLWYDIFFLMLETEELISEIDSRHTLQEASELWSCNETGSWQFELTSALVSTWLV